MTDGPLHIGDNSPEYVAYRLMLDIAKVEKKGAYPIGIVSNSRPKVGP